MRYKHITFDNYEELWYFLLNHADDDDELDEVLRHLTFKDAQEKKESFAYFMEQIK